MSVERRMIPTRVGPLAVRAVGEGPPTVLWHSLFVDERSWERVEPELARSRRLIVITGPGHGASGDPGHRYTMEDCAAAATTVLDALAVRDRVDWLGNAWGGHVGIVFAAARPDRCRTLVTVGTPVQAYRLTERLRTLMLLAAHRLLGPAGFLQDAVADVLLSSRTRRHDADAVALVKDCLATADPAALRNAVVSISLRRKDLTAALPRIVAPTLFVTGTDHEGWTPRQARACAGLLPSASVAEVTDAAYLAPLEAPAETLRVLDRFWQTACTVGT